MIFRSGGPLGGPPGVRRQYSLRMRKGLLWGTRWWGGVGRDGGRASEKVTQLIPAEAGGAAARLAGPAGPVGVSPVRQSG